MFHLQLLSTFTVNVLIYMIYFCGCDSFLWLKRKSPENCIILLHLFMNKDSAVLKCSKAKKTNVFSLNGLYWSVQDFHLAMRRHCKAMKAMKVTCSLTLLTTLPTAQSWPWAWREVSKARFRNRQEKNILIPSENFEFWAINSANGQASWQKGILPKDIQLTRVSRVFWGFIKFSCNFMGLHFPEIFIYYTNEAWFWFK